MPYATNKAHPFKFGLALLVISIVCAVHLVFGGQIFETTGTPAWTSYASVKKFELVKVAVSNAWGVSEDDADSYTQYDTVGKWVFQYYKQTATGTNEPYYWIKFLDCPDVVPIEPNIGDIGCSYNAVDFWLVINYQGECQKIEITEDQWLYTLTHPEAIYKVKRTNIGHFVIIGK